MDIGRINGKLNSTNIENAKNKVSEGDFEKHMQSALDKKDDKELKKVCKEFEGILLNMMYKEMKATIPKNSLIPDDTGKEIFDSMLDDKLVEEASKGKGLGLADTLYKQLKRQSRHRGDNKGDTEGAE